MIITTEASNKAGSNGVLISLTYLPGNKVKYVWKSKYPVAYYLISFAVGPYIEYNAYAKIDGIADSVLIQNYLINGSTFLNQHKITIEKTKFCMNLFNPETIIHFSIPERNYVTLKIFDLLGKEFATLVSEYKTSGDYSVKFNSGSLATGVYIYRLHAGIYDASRKLIILK
jgi:hypothetical protein